jgi:hypothetical protein
MDDDMSGDELITITIVDPHSGNRMSTCYSILQADLHKGSKGDYHLMNLDALIERFDSEKRKKYERAKI